MEIHIIERLANSKIIGIPDSNTCATQLYSFCKWSALIVALLASFTTLIKKIITRLQNNRLLSKPLLVDDDDWSDIDYDTDTDISSCSEEEDDGSDDNVKDDGLSSAIFRFKGSFNYGDGVGLRRRVNRSFGDLLSEFESGKNNVVRLWEENVRPIFDGIAQTPAVVVSTETTNRDGSFLKVWDTRVGSRIPQIMSEWTPKLGKIIGINGLGSVYVSDDVTGEVKVADMRNARSPLLSDVRWAADSVGGEVKDD